MRLYQLLNSCGVLVEQGSGPLPNSAANSLPTPGNSAAGRYAQIVAKLLTCIRFSTSRGRFSGLKWIFSLLSGKSGGPVGWLGALLLGIVISGAACAQSVLTYHGSSDRSGNFIVPALTWERARPVLLDP